MRPYRRVCMLTLNHMFGRLVQAENIMELLTQLDPEDGGTVDQEELVVWHDATVARFV